MKVKFALAFYYIAIGFLVAVAATIVIKLIFWPSCTQSGNLCVIEPWSVAGLAGTVLGVAATMLAILGAVAVAAWWTNLNNQVTNQVTKLYETQQKEVNEHVDRLLEDQKKKVDEQFVASQARIGSEIETLKQSTRDIETNLVDSLLEINGPWNLEKWSQQTYQKRRLPPSVPLKMALGYLRDFERTKKEASKRVNYEAKMIGLIESQYEEYKLQPTHIEAIAELIRARDNLISLSRENRAPAEVLPYNLTSWEHCIYWLDIATMQLPTEQPVEVDGLTLQSLRGKVAQYQQHIDELRQSHKNLKEQTKVLYSEVKTSLASVSENDYDKAYEIIQVEDHFAEEEKEASSSNA